MNPSFLTKGMGHDKQKLRMDPIFLPKKLGPLNVLFLRFDGTFQMIWTQNRKHQMDLILENMGHDTENIEWPQRFG